jgi:hypothetical protein
MLRTFHDTVSLSAVQPLRNPERLPDLTRQRPPAEVDAVYAQRPNILRNLTERLTSRLTHRTQAQSYA